MLCVRASNLSLLPLAHGFFGRRGGVSSGLYESLNCGLGSKDDSAKVRENRKRAMVALGPKTPKLVTLYQIHSATVVTVTEPWTDGAQPQADAMVTREANLALGILTADCAPVLFADIGARVIGAAHAGWKGAISGVLENTIAAMEKLGARRRLISAAIGPCISRSAYEVGGEFVEAFRAQDAAHERFFAKAPRAGHAYFDLEGFAAHRLRQAGVGNIEKLSLCTYRRAEDFFSFRRATHRKEPDYGRELSAIALMP